MVRTRVVRTRAYYARIQLTHLQLGVRSSVTVSPDSLQLRYRRAGTSSVKDNAAFARGVSSVPVL